VGGVKRTRPPRRPPQKTAVEKLVERGAFASLSGPSGDKREECMIVVAWTGLNDARDKREGGHGHLMMRDRVMADLGLEAVPVPGFTNEEMQLITFAAKMQALKCLTARKTRR